MLLIHDSYFAKAMKVLNWGIGTIHQVSVAPLIKQVHPSIHSFKKMDIRSYWKASETHQPKTKY